MNPRLSIVGLLALLALAVSLAFAADGESANTEVQGRSESYWADKQTALKYLGEDGSDSIADVSTSVTTYLVDLCGGQADAAVVAKTNKPGVRQNLSISGRFTNAAATATVYVVYYYYDGSSLFVLGVEEAQTLTAGSAQDGSSLYMSPTLVLDTYGATHAAVLVTAVSAGTVNVGVGSF